MRQKSKLDRKLDRFNFWNHRINYKVHSSVQEILRNTLSRVDSSTGFLCTSDQGGSQDNGGGSCNADGTGGD